MQILRRILARLFSRVEISWHSIFIRDLARLLQPKLYVEIGIYEAETFNLVTPHSSFSIAVDTNAEALTFVAAQEKVFRIHGTVNEATRFLTELDERIDLAFVDANHAYRMVISDFDALEPFISNNGIVLLHDTFPGSRKFVDPQFCHDAYRAIPILRMKYPEWTFVTIPIHPGLTICQRLSSLPLWLEGDLS